MNSLRGLTLVGARRFGITEVRRTQRLLRGHFTGLNLAQHRTFATTTPTRVNTRKPILEQLRMDGRSTVITGKHGHCMPSRSFLLTYISGGARGIGLAIAKVVAELGSDVALLDMIEPQEDLVQLSDKYGTQFKYFKTDVTQQKSLESSFSEVAILFGKIHQCVTAAGIALDKPFLEHTWEDSRRILEVNVLGTFHSAQLAARYMRDQNTGGSIVTIASIAAHCAIPSQRVSIYGASKGAVKLMTKTLAVELAPLNIRVNSLSPGFIATDMTGDMADKQPELWKVFNQTPPLGRIGQREDLTIAVAYLLSEAAAYTSGADLPITGALHAGRIVA